MSVLRMVYGPAYWEARAQAKRDAWYAWAKARIEDGPEPDRGFYRLYPRRD